jgi:hypothetical protein
MGLLHVGALLPVVASWHLHTAAALSPSETHYTIGPLKDLEDDLEEVVPKYMLAGSCRRLAASSSVLHIQQPLQHELQYPIATLRCPSLQARLPYHHLTESGPLL